MQPKMNRHWRCPANFYNRDGTYRFNIYIFWEVTHDWLPVPTVSRDLILFSSLGKSSFQGLKKNNYTELGWISRLVGWFGCHQFYFPIPIGNNHIIPIDELIYFSEGWPSNHQPARHSVVRWNRRNHRNPFWSCPKPLFGWCLYRVTVLSIQYILVHVSERWFPCEIEIALQ